MPTMENLCIILGGIASALFILGFFGFDRAWLQMKAQGMKTRFIVLSLLLGVSLSVLGTGLYLKLSRSEITPENVESHVKEWLETFRLTTQKISDPEHLYFGWKITFDDGTAVGLIRSKELNRYLTLEVELVPAPEHKTLFEKLSKEEQHFFLEKLTLEIAKAKVHADMRDSLNSIKIIRLIPITKNLTESMLLDEIDSFYLDEKFVDSWLVMALEHPNTTPP
jgi:hypothetical protein